MSADTIQAAPPGGVAPMRSLLRVNLTDGTVATEEVSADYRDRFISGKGLGAAYLLDELEPGTDPLSLGNVVSWLMEVVEKGIVEYDIEFGDATTATRVVTDIAHREGVGDALADGTARAAERLCDGHPDAREAAVEVKGLELPAYDPRASYSMALAYATSDRGGCHQRAFPIGTDALGGERDPYGIDGHAEAVIADQDENALTYNMVACDFTAYDYERAAEWLTALGYDVAIGDLETVGEHAWTLTRLFNVREGFVRAEDTLPERFTRPLEAGGPADGNAITRAEFDAMLAEYYERRGWDADGVPTRETLERLDVADFAVGEVTS